MAVRKLKPVEANDGSYAGLVLAAFDALYDTCPQCGGTGEADDCSCMDDTCVCLHPTPADCSCCNGSGTIRRASRSQEADGDAQ